MIIIIINEYTKLIKFIYILILLQTCYALYSKEKYIKELTPKNFDRLVVRSDEVWLIKFYAPWCIFCQNLVSEYTQAANVLSGIVKVGAVNADEHRELAALYNVRTLPSIKIFGVDKQKPEDYTEGKNVKEIVSATLNAAKAKVISRLDSKEQEVFLSPTKDADIVTLTDENFEEMVLRSNTIWMVKFYAPWCGYCRSLQPQWNQAAREFKDPVKFGALDCTVNPVESSKYKITGYPTIKLFIPGSAPVDYDGDRSAHGMINWLTDKYEETIPTPQVHQMINEQLVIYECEGKETSIIAFLPNHMDCLSACRNSHITILNKLASRLKRKKWCWLWSEADAQPDIEDILKIGGASFPVVTAVSYYNKTYSTFVGNFTEDNLYKFLIYEGFKNSIEIQHFPAIFDVEPWDGKDKIIHQVHDEEL